jgi:hypothetical protein
MHVYHFITYKMPLLKEGTLWSPLQTFILCALRDSKICSVTDPEILRGRFGAGDPPLKESKTLWYFGSEILFH